MRTGGRLDDREEVDMKQELWSIIEELEAVVTDGVHLPLSDGFVISETEIFALLDELRAVLPEELSEARAVVKERERILKEARSEAERLRESASEQAERMTSESVITNRAEEHAKETLEEAEEMARNIKVEAHEYADNVLERLELVLDKASRQVTDGRKHLKQKTSDVQRGSRQAAATEDNGPSA